MHSTNDKDMEPKITTGQNIHKYLYLTQYLLFFLVGGDPLNHRIYFWEKFMVLSTWWKDLV